MRWNFSEIPNPAILYFFIRNKNFEDPEIPGIGIYFSGMGYRIPNPPQASRFNLGVIMTAHKAKNLKKVCE